MHKKTLLVRRLLLLAIISSTYNLITFFILLLRQNASFSDPAVWANIPQIFMTILFFYIWRQENPLSTLWHKEDKFVRRGWIVTLITLSWIALYLISVYIWIIGWVDTGDWSLWANFILALGIPVVQSGAPLLGLFHSAILGQEGDFVWGFDGGVGISWLIFNVASISLIVLLNWYVLKSEFTTINENNNFLMKNFSNTSRAHCHSCSQELSEGQKFCSSCGAQTKSEDLVEGNIEEAECSNCGSQLEADQKFCANCGHKVESQKTDSNNAQNLLNIPVEGKSLNVNMKIVAAAVIGLIAIIYLSSSGLGGKSEQEECFDREMAKMGAFIQPKEWAIKSRLYCQSMYP